MWALLLSAILGGGAILGAVAMDVGESADYITQDDVVVETSPMGDGVCDQDGEEYQHEYRLGDMPQEQTRQRNRDRDPECEENPLQQRDRLQDRKQNRTHDGECEKFRLKQENGDQDGEKYQYKHENMDEDAKYKFNYRYKKHIGLIEGP
jgi:hypothetical protein